MKRLSVLLEHPSKIFESGLLLAIVLAPSLILASNEVELDDAPSQVPKLMTFNIGQEGSIFATRPNYVITHRDMDRFALTIPPEHRAPTLVSMERLTKVVDNISIRLGLAQRAVELGYLEEPEMQAQLVHATAVALSNAYLQRKTAEAELDNYELAAEELYLRDPLLFNRDDRRVSFEQILISPATQREIDAMTEVLEINERLEAGESFNSLISLYSDDPQVESNEGLYAQVQEAALDPAVLEQLKALEPGVISSPFRSEFGWHFVRLVERFEPESPAFEEVKGQFMAEARAQHLQNINDSILAEIVQEPIEIPEQEVSRFLSRHGSNSVEF